MVKSNRWSEIPIAILKDTSVVEFKPSEAPLDLKFTQDGDRPQRIHLSFLSDRPHIAKIFATTFWIDGQKHARMTRSNIAGNLKLFVDFLNWKREAGVEINDTFLFTYSLFQEFAKWLIEIRKLKESTAANKFSSTCSFVRAARLLEPEAFPKDFSLPENCFPGVVARRANSNVLQFADFQRIVSVAEEKVNDLRSTYKEGDVPESATTLIPFMIVLAVRTAMNPCSLYELSRDCLEPHVILTNARYVVWTKRRSKTRKQKQLHRESRGGVIELIRFLQNFTAPLVERAAKPDQKRLFLYWGTVNDLLKIKRVVVMSGGKIGYQLEPFITKNGLPKFSFGHLRATAATHFYHQNGGNLRKVQSILGHKSRETTELYIGREIVQPMHNLAIREAQAQMVQRVIAIPKRAKEALAELSNLVPLGNQSRIADGEFNTGFCKCIDPYNSPQEGQKKGECCTLLDACWTCPNALFFLEDLPGVIALRNYFLKKKVEMGSELWEAHYRYKVEIIERDIIGSFTDEQIIQAERETAINTDIELLMKGEFIK